MAQTVEALAFLSPQHAVAIRQAGDLVLSSGEDLRLLLKTTTRSTHTTHIALSISPLDPGRAAILIALEIPGEEAYFEAPPIDVSLLDFVWAKSISVRGRNLKLSESGRELTAILSDGSEEQFSRRSRPLFSGELKLYGAAS